MKKWIILTAMAIFFMYPIISITQMADAGSFDLHLLVKSAVYGLLCLGLYFYTFWLLPPAHMSQKMIITIFIAIICTILDAIGYLELSSADSWRVAFIVVIAIIERVLLEAERYAKGIKESKQGWTDIESFEKEEELEEQREREEWETLSPSEKTRRFEKKVKEVQRLLILSERLCGKEMEQIDVERIRRHSEELVKKDWLMPQKES